jgi:SNF2 family DNA or RNA helicase
MTETFRPFDYQLPMIKHLLANDRAALFVSPGKGKTVVTLTAIDTLATVGQFKAALIIAPLRVCSITWPAQVARWSHTSWLKVVNLRTSEGMQAWHDGTADIYLINSELLPNRLPLMFPKRKTFVCPVDTLVIDELSLAKNPQSKRFKALHKHLGGITRRWGLTGTPIPNNYLDLFMQVKMLDDGKRLGKTFTGYRDDYFYPADYMGYTYKLFAGSKEQINRRLSDLALVMVGDPTDLPSSSIIDVPAVLPPAARKQYKTLEKEMLAEIAYGEITAPSAGVLVNKLLQMTSGAVYDEDRNVLPVHDAKLEALRSLLDKHKGEPVLILTAFKHESARILATIPEARMFNELLLGEWQDGRIPVWVADPRSLSHGIDGLQKSCRIAIWCSLTYSHETYVQTNARLIRTGQTAETIIYRIIAPGTIDDAVAEALRDKSDTQSGMLHAVRALQRMTLSRNDNYYENILRKTERPKMAAQAAGNHAT